MRGKMRYVMMIICVLFLVLSTIKKKYKKIFVILSGLTLLVFATFREFIFSGSQIGNDYFSYQAWFENISNIKISITNDFLFNILMLLVSKVTGNYLVFIFITSSLWIYSIYKFSIDNSPNYVFTIFLILAFGVYELGLSAIRQSMAISCFLLSFKYIKQKKLIKYICGVVIASLFHSSALFMLLVYPFVNIKVDILIKEVVIVLSVVAFVVLVNLGVYEELCIKYVPYYSIKYEGVGTKLNSNYTVFGVAMSTFIMLCFFKSSREHLVVSDNPIYVYLLLLILFSYIATLHATLGRMLQYFMPAVALAIPSTLCFAKGEKLQKIACSAVIVLFTIMFCV